MHKPLDMTTNTDKKSRNGRKGLGLFTPVVVRSPGITVEAWRNTDNPKARTSFHVAVKIRGQRESNLFAATPDRIKQLADTFAALHAQLTGATAAGADSDAS